MGLNQRMKSASDGMGSLRDLCRLIRDVDIRSHKNSLHHWINHIRRKLKIYATSSGDKDAYALCAELETLENSLYNVDQMLKRYGFK